jgi:large repetitive protein
MANIINGSAGADTLNGLSGDNTISGGLGADKLNGGAGIDSLNGGAGSDTVSGNSGDDLLIYKAAENVGASDVYDGGSGSGDVLRIDLTMSEWLKPAFQTDLANYLSFLNLNTHWKTLEASNAVFNFTSFGLSVSKIEYVEIYVDGVKLTPENNNVIVAGDTMSATEDAAGTSGNLLANDSILDQVLTFTNTNPSHGTVAFATDFSAVNNPKAFATYTADATYWNVLAVGESGTDSFTYTVTDADGQTATSTVTVTVAGVNDAVAITSGAQAGSVVEDPDQTPAPGDSLTATGTITFTDPDLTDVHTRSITTSPANPLGTLTLDAVSEAANTATGSVGWTYTLDNAAAQKLGAGVEVVETYVVTIADAHGSSVTQDVKITITGTNDAPVITPVVVADTLGETNAGLATDGSVTVADVDVGDVVALSIDSVSVGGTGSTPLANGVLKAMMTVDPDGAWHFNSGSEAFDNLPAGKTLVLSYVIKADDGHTGTDTETVTVTITGANDAAVIGTPLSADVTEDLNVNGGGQLTATGTLSISDLDDGEASFQTTVTPAAGALGSLTLAADGGYTYAVANADVQFLGAGDTQVDKFTVAALDGTTKEASFTITGVNDAAVIGDPTVDDVTEDLNVVGGNLTAVGTISIGDDDAGEATFNTTVTPDAGVLGSLTLAADGSYTYSVANTAVQYLGAGDTRDETFTVTSVDGTSKAVTFTIHGVNDAAVIGEPTVDDVTEDLNVVGGNLTAVGTISIGDDDAGEATFNTTVTPDAGVLGSLTLAADGSYTYSVANTAVQYLGAGDTKDETFTVTSVDGTSKAVTFTIHGVNDAAVIGDPTVDDVTEDLNVVGGNLTAVGTISIGDDDAGEATFNTTVTPALGNLGSLTLAADGSYTYAVGNSLTQSLGQGATKVDTFTVTSTDGTTKEVSFTIHGVNDAPVFTTGGTGTVAENSPISTVVYDANVTDVDGAPATFTLTGTDAGKFDIDGSTGEVTFKVSPDYEAPTDNGGNNVYDITVNAFDGTDTTAQAVAITVTNVNETPTITSNGGGATATVSVLENTPAVTTVVAIDSDAGTTFTYSLVGGDDQAKFTINASGQLSFLTPPDFEAPTDTAPTNSYQVTVRVSDGTLFDDQAITVNVTNVNEADPNDFDGFSGGSTGAGTSGADTLRGTSGNDSISAGNGTDLVYGLAGNDTIAGGGAADMIYGGSGNDSILAGPDTDWIYGGSGNDTIQGDNGTDFIAGGYGADLLSGNQIVTDTFVYFSLDDSTLVAFDTVTDFGSGSDKIDLSGIDADATTLGNQDFNDTIYTDGLVHGAGTLYFNPTTAILLGDVDGDGVADLKIQLQAGASLMSADIIG